MYRNLYKFILVIAIALGLTWVVRYWVGKDLAEVSLYKFNNQWVYCEQYFCYDPLNIPIEALPEQVYREHTDTCQSPTDWNCPLIKLPYD